MSSGITQLFYLIASVLFIVGLKGLTRPRTAPRGNMLSGAGMLLAVVTALISEANLHWGYIVFGLAIGMIIGFWLAYKTQMTAMPQLVAIFNGFGGGASLLVATAAIVSTRWSIVPLLDGNMRSLIAAAVSIVIGTVTFSGSILAFTKLQGVYRRSLQFKGLQLIKGMIFLIMLLCALMLVIFPAQLFWLPTLILLSALFGFMLVAPIGGANMPVVIAVLNSYSGLAACATGFVLNNTMLIIAGSLVGASGMLLTSVMCKAMNRSFIDVILGKPMAKTSGPSQDDVYAGKIKSTSAEEVAMVLESARRVVIVPGFGMAVSQAQFAVRDLAQRLEKRKIEVLFGIHPVAGRMPGHMNVLLAEADIDYDKLKDMESINPIFDQTDVALVIGANDVVNPDARQNPNSPIAGMPVLNVDRSKTVVVIKRSLSPGFAGIPNILFAADNTLMLFEDGKAAVTAISAALKG
jgi:H+-translocating NAD(P) transhydrogenase subunit beta